MKSIKGKMLLSFGVTALLSIGLIIAVVTWRMNRGIQEQSESFVASMTEKTTESLRYPHQTATYWMRKSIRHITETIRHNPDLIKSLASQRPLELMAVLERIVSMHEIDLVLLFDLEGHLQTSLPIDLNEFDIDHYLATCELWRQWWMHIAEDSQEESPDPLMHWDALTVFDPTTLQIFQLGTDVGTADGALVLLSITLIENDFGDPVGMSLIGQVINKKHELLQQLTDTTGIASAIYLNQQPIVQAGFGKDAKAFAEQEALMLPAKVKEDVYYGGSEGKALHLTLADQPYLTVCSPLVSFLGIPVGCLCTGVPESGVTELQQQIFAQNLAIKGSLQNWILGVGFISLALFSVVSLAISTTIVSPIKALSAIAKQVALGNVRQQIHVRTCDEIGELSHSLRTMVASFQEIAATSQAIAQGDLEQDITPRSEQDVLGQTLQRMSDYLSTIATVAAAIAEGDLTTRISMRSNTDVFGRTMSLMTQGLQALVQQIGTSADRIAVIGTQIKSLTDRNTQLAQQVQISVEDMVSTMTELSVSVEQVAQNMDSLLVFVQQTSSSVTEIRSSVSSIASRTVDLAGQTEQMSRVVSESVQTVQNITQKTETSQQLSQETAQDALEGQQAVEYIRERMDSIHLANRQTVELVDRFAKRSEEIGSVLDVIRNINEQSSLLALNASIISAQAGSHGRGFSVIAEEMRNLSNEVDIAMKNIAGQIQTLQQEMGVMVQVIANGTAEIDQGVNLAQKAEQRLQKILSSAKHSSLVADDIAEALHAQDAANHDVIRAIERVSSMTDEITKATGEQKTNVRYIHEAISNILDMATQTKQATDEQLHGVRQVIETSKGIGILAEQNFESSQQINQTVMVELTPQANGLLQAVERFTLSEEKKSTSKRESLTQYN